MKFGDIVCFDDFDPGEPEDRAMFVAVIDGQSDFVELSPDSVDVDGKPIAVGERFTPTEGTNVPRIIES